MNSPTGTNGGSDLTDHRAGLEARDGTGRAGINAATTRASPYEGKIDYESKPNKQIYDVDRHRRGAPSSHTPPSGSGVPDYGLPGMWLSLLPVLFLDAPIRPFTAPGAIVGLALSAVLVTAIVDGRAGVRDPLERSLRWRIGVHWYKLAVLGITGGMFLIATIFLGAAPLNALVHEWPLLLTAFVPEVLVALVTVQIFEELGWTGFMQQRLQDRHGAFRASLMVALGFALIHYPTYFIEDTITVDKALLVLVQMIPIVVFAVFLRCLITWLYNGSGGSVVIVALLHAVFNTPLPTEVIPGADAMWLPLAAVVVLAVPVMVLTKGRLAYQPKVDVSQGDATLKGMTTLLTGDA